MAATGGALSIMGGILGGIGDIYKAAKYKRPQFPKATGQENRLRRFTMQDLANARQNVYGNEEIYNQALPYMMGAIPGYSADIETDPNATARYEDIARQVGERQGLVQQKMGARTAYRATKGQGKAARKGAQQTLRGVKKQLRTGPKLDELRTQLNQIQGAVPHMRITKNAPTETDINAQQIQDALSNRTLEALRGGVPNPTLEHSIERENAQLEDHMRNQLGPDWENSTAGIQARQQFNQYANDQRDMSNRRDIEQMYQEQLGGQGAQYGFAGHQQQLLAQPSLQGLRFAQAGANMGGESTQAQSPYQFDRQGMWQMEQNPRQIYGDMMAQSGDRWSKVGGSVGTSMGGGDSPSGGAPSGGGGGGGFSGGSMGNPGSSW